MKPVTEEEQAQLAELRLTDPEYYSYLLRRLDDSDPLPGRRHTLCLRRVEEAFDAGAVRKVKRSMTRTHALLIAETVLRWQVEHEWRVHPLAESYISARLGLSPAEQRWAKEYLKLKGVISIWKPPTLAGYRTTLWLVGQWFVRETTREERGES
ncbi:hypothetical protein SAMN05443575_1475 [Jatrophihabitans endophyticus]|uniref:Uncharacterized protein n=1 Tax=Jatrophihabitans endophyticus TaxID=1206085 RepID=A0A1M5HCE8_9ACTN|nr:hypothetical protein [Jatrophihabitans endophyticus]SHG13669.1 hypothetical protein SAMN05443575_1475 [Jatrophihabitans endophyticus]